MGKLLDSQTPGTSSKQFQQGEQNPAKASKMLENAISQMDGIISGASNRLTSTGQDGSSLPVTSVLATAQSLAMGLQQSGNHAPAPDPLTAGIINTWLDTHLPNVLWDYTATPEHIHQTQVALMKSYMNTSINPCEDFYEYACGNSLHIDPQNLEHKNVALGTKYRINRALEQLLKTENDDGIVTLTEDEIIAERKAKNYYVSCMNAIEHFDVEAKSVLEFLQTLKGWPMVASGEPLDNSDWIKLTTYLQKFGQDFFLSMKYIRDANGELVLKLYTDLKSYKPIPKKIDGLIHKMENIYGQGFVSKAVLEDIISFSNEIEVIHIHKIETFPMERLRTEIPEINWNELYLETFGKNTDFSDIVTTQYFRYAEELAKLLKKTPPRTVINYILFRFAYHLMDVLDQDWNINHKFNTRSDYCLEKLHENMDDIMSRMFARRYYDETSHRMVGELFNGVDLALHDYIRNLEWADEETTHIAIFKLHYIFEILGYNLEDAEDMSSYPEVQNDAFFQNSLSLLQYRIHKEDDREQERNPKHRSTVRLNDAAMYVKNGDKLDMSTGLFQTPTFNKHSPKYSNYGKAAFLIAYGLSYGFSPRYIRYMNGVESDWWNAHADEVYRYTMECFVAQYNKYKWIDIDVPVNGERTLDENVATNLGVQLAYTAYMDWLDDHTDSEENHLLPEFNLTGEQLFFVSFAQTTCATPPAGKPEPGFEHVPNDESYKVHGVFSNSEAFSKAFHCPTNSRMNPARKCKF